jgi:DNA-binding PadR family transcriptional regulator
VPSDRPLTPLELEVLTAGLVLMARGQSEFYGYDLASHLEDANGAYRRTGFSNLYRTLDRLESMKLLTSRWDLSGSRPRRLYEVTGLARQRMAEPSSAAARGMTPRLVYS